VGVICWIVEMEFLKIIGCVIFCLMFLFVCDGIFFSAIGLFDDENTEEITNKRDYYTKKNKTINRETETFKNKINT